MGVSLLKRASEQNENDCTALWLAVIWKEAGRRFRRRPEMQIHGRRRVAGERGELNGGVKRLLPLSIMGLSPNSL